ncbi:UBC-like protein [Favolaschia claudopus]|uniref:UBC-like protein n=1 Tax=Favolaschia claudopus TaxID=2862362 RepID=A0AAW0BCV7_9AGAR
MAGLNKNNSEEWHCTLRGPAGTEFEGGLYHFRILLPAEYPFRPPSIMMLTPSGRFETDTKICISFTSYHEELWQPAWGVRTAIIGLQGFFPLKGKAAVGIGSIEHPIPERKRLAQLSRSWVCSTCQESNLTLLPDPPSGDSGFHGTGTGRVLEESRAPEPPTPVAAVPDTNLAPPQVADVSPAPRTVSQMKPQRPPILLDGLICVILVLVCSIVFRRMF